MNSKNNKCDEIREPHSIPRGLLRVLVMRLLDSEAMSGTDIMNMLHEKSGGQWQPSPGSIYPILSSLEEDDLIETERVDGRSKIYTLTDEGKDTLKKMLEHHAKYKHKARLGPKLWIHLMNPQERVEFLSSVINFNLEELDKMLPELGKTERKQLVSALEKNRELIEDLIRRLK